MSLGKQLPTPVQIRTAAIEILADNIKQGLVIGSNEIDPLIFYIGRHMYIIESKIDDYNSFVVIDNNNQEVTSFTYEPYDSMMRTQSGGYRKRRGRCSTRRRRASRRRSIRRNK